MSERCRHYECPYWHTDPYEYGVALDGGEYALCADCQLDKDEGWTSFVLVKKEVRIRRHVNIALR